MATGLGEPPSQKTGKIESEAPARSYKVADLKLRGFHPGREGMAGQAWLGPSHEGYITLEAVPPGAKMVRLTITDFVHDAVFDEGRVSVEGCLVPVRRTRTSERSGEWEVIVPREPIAPKLLDVVIRVPALYAVPLHGIQEPPKRAALSLGEVGVWCDPSP